MSVKPRKPDGTPKGGGPYARDFGVPEDSAQENFTDPDSRIMKHANGGFDQSYNGQTAVDAENGIVIAAELVQCAADSGELVPMLEAIRTNLGAAPEQTLADAGYRDEAVFAALADGDTQLIVSLGRERGATSGRSTRRRNRTPPRWPSDCRARTLVPPTVGARGSSSHRTAGSST